MKLFNKEKKERIQSIKINYLPIYLGFISIFLALTMLTLTTYAWFTGTSVVRGSSINSSTLYIDLLADKDYLDEINYQGDRTRFKTYSRVNEDGKNEDYFVITDSEIPIIKINNVEPGQIYPVKFYVVNRGELATKFSAAFNIQVDKDGNELSFTGLETLEMDKETLGQDNYDYYKSILNEKQLDSEGNDIGGHLEDILDVYVGSDENDAIPKNYVGKLSQVLNGDLGAYTGYSLPVKELVDNGKIVPKTVNIVDLEGNVLMENVTEIQKLEYLIKMPEDATSIYEYASLTFSLGATATQAEYEKDGTNSMIYDSFGWPDDSNDQN